MPAKYIGPDYTTCITFNGRNMNPKAWPEEDAKKEIEANPWLADYFDFSDAKGTKPKPVAPPSDNAPTA